MKKLSKTYDVVVAGGGIAGMCAAIASARHGAKTALVQNRPVLGGNASSEIRMHICGADQHARRENARETGILEEILLNNKAVNETFSWPIFDEVMWESCRFQEGLDLYLNTNVDNLKMNGDTIESIHAVCLTNETEYDFYGDIFVDATGDALVGELAGAEYMYGREDKNTFGEPDALDSADEYTMGNSIMFQARDMGHPVKFTKPKWAYTYTEEDMKFREHEDINSGYWWIELGGKTLNTIYDFEEIRDELMKTVYGIWDHIKNGGDHGAENYQLEWVGMLPGKRESRRLVGDYILNENDILALKRFDDAVAYGGWAMDCHVIEGFKTGGEEPTKYIFFDDVYTIPYRCLYSKNIGNLMLSGRAFSTSHLAFASTRVMATCAVCGQAVGTAAAMAISDGVLPRKIGEKIGELQQTLLKDDCYIPGIKNTDENDFVRKAVITASSCKEGYNPADIANGVSRIVGNDKNMYCSDGIGDLGEYLDIDFGEEKALKEIDIKFDSNLSREIEISINKWVQDRQEKHLPSELVKSYEISFFKGTKQVEKLGFSDNIQRFCKINLENSIMCDKIRIRCFDTYGAEDIRIFEVRAY